MSKVGDGATARVFAALGEPTRLTLLSALGTRGARSATALTAGSGLSRQAIVKHLRVLETAGLVAHERRGREVLYDVKPHGLDDARRFLAAASARWDRALTRLRGMVETPPPPKTKSKHPEAT